MNGGLRSKQYIEKILGVIVADGLARVSSTRGSFAVRSYNDTSVTMANLGAPLEGDLVYWWKNGTPYYNVSTGSWNATTDNLEFGKNPQEVLDNVAQRTRFVFEAERYGYGSGKRGGTLTFALAVMYVYFIILGAYFVYVMLLSRLWFKEPVPTIVAWDDIANLVLLAWNSKPPTNSLLSRSSVESKNGRKWMNGVGIMADDTGRAHLTTTSSGLQRLKRGFSYH
ncbi:hypothetical protein N656DRAFT_719508 [Canariomyces notabilis]|uniref:Uncharacterized protein n=1 Tax=Canariomyces notabilis TaxID=2074819 RepID=A0AAN6QI50_9PEZI|nr:hypothetical protein N656DRAFT_719508 [Canariomyces arenarius]